MTKSLPRSVQVIYSLGELGWSILFNIVSFSLVYFYIPPVKGQTSFFPIYITQKPFLTILNAVTLIAAFGHLWNAAVDPIIANWSDRSTNKKGRRTPFLVKATFPACIFLSLLFFPPVSGESPYNIYWLILLSALFYFFISMYMTPYYALLVCLAKTSAMRLDLSTLRAFTYSFGIMISASLGFLAETLEKKLAVSNVEAFQISVIILSLTASMFMLAPGLFIDENKYSNFSSTTVPLWKSMKQCFGTRFFLSYAAADFFYMMSLTLIQTGLLYYLTVLLLQSASMLGKTILIIFGVAFIFYPVFNFLAKKIGKKWLVIFAFFSLSLLFLFLAFLGKLPFSAPSQIYLLSFIAGIPIAALGVLPMAILADIADYKSKKTGEHYEAMFFAARSFLMKIGQTSGVFIFAALSNFGKDVNDDFGIRLSGIVGMCICLTAMIIFCFFKENELTAELKKLDGF